MVSDISNCQFCLYQAFLVFILAIRHENINQIYQSPIPINTHINLTTKANPDLDIELLQIENNLDQLSCYQNRMIKLIAS